MFAVAITVPVALVFSNHQSDIKMENIQESHFSKYSPPTIPEYMLGMHYDPVLYDELIKKQIAFTKPTRLQSIWPTYVSELGKIIFSTEKPSSVSPILKNTPNIFDIEENRQKLIKAIWSTQFDVGINDREMMDHSRPSILINDDLVPTRAGQFSPNSTWINNYYNDPQNFNGTTWKDNDIFSWYMRIELHEHSHALNSDRNADASTFVKDKLKLFLNDINENFRDLYKKLKKEMKFQGNHRYQSKMPTIDFHLLFPGENVPSWDSINQTAHGKSYPEFSTVPSRGFKTYEDEAVARIISGLLYIDPLRPGWPTYAEVCERIQLNKKFNGYYFWDNNNLNLNYQIMKSYLNHVVGINGKDTIVLNPGSDIYFTSLETAITKKLKKVIVHYKNIDIDIPIVQKQSPIGFNWKIGQDDKSKYKYILDRAWGFYKTRDLWLHPEDNINTKVIPEGPPQSIEFLDVNNKEISTENAQVLLRTNTNHTPDPIPYRVVNGNLIQVSDTNPWPASQMKMVNDNIL